MTAESVRSDKGAPDIIYYCVMVSHVNDDIVLFTQPLIGTLLTRQGASGFNCTGHHYSEGSQSLFSLYSGTVTLEND